MSIVVAVRVRPFNQRENELNSRLCVKMSDKTTTLVDETGAERSFTFDYSFWSHDGSVTEADGYLRPESRDFADQKLVYETVGASVLENALKGYHCTLFAYGQTGSGKSYSMVGYGTNKGIVPQVTEQLFEKIKKEKSAQRSFEVNVSMLEIYNEKIQDLLISVGERPSTGLKIRESKTLGVYVEGLTKHPVDSYKAIEQKMAEGFRSRTIAATQMNAHSSRAHTIISIEFKQTEFLLKHKIERVSVISLVDLAGSEKVAKSGAVGDRLKEGCSINKSLSVLGQVISSLADKSLGRNKNKVIPYRDSALTRILQNALGGNSKTLMICAISPSNDNYEESLSTLRYADQAKRIQCHAVINESESDHKIRELQKENDELKKVIAMLKTGGSLNFSNASMLQDLQARTSVVENDKLDKTALLEKKLEEYEQSLKANQMIIEEFEKTFEQRLNEEKSKKRLSLLSEEGDVNSAHLININEDPQLAGKLLYNIDKVKVLNIGRKSPDFEPQIILNSIGIQPKHAKITAEQFGYFIAPEVPDASKFLTCNGARVTEKRKLTHLDRIGFGVSTFFIFKNPKSPAGAPEFPTESDIDWEFCQKELASQGGVLKGFNLTSSIFRSKIVANPATLEKEMTSLKTDYDEKMKKVIQEHEHVIQTLKMELLNQTQLNEVERENLIRVETENLNTFLADIETEFQQKMEEAQERQDEINREKTAEMKEMERYKIQRKLFKIEPNITEVNLIAKELKRKIEFEVEMNYAYVDNYDWKIPKDSRNKYKLDIKVKNKELGYEYVWDLPKFKSRYYIIKDVFVKFYETGEIPELPQDKDPFWDPPDLVKVGKCYIRMFNLAYLIDNPCECEVVNETGQIGTIRLNLYPSSQAGEMLTDDDPVFDHFDDNPKFLINKPLYFVVEIGKLSMKVPNMNSFVVGYSIKDFDSAAGKFTTSNFKSKEIPAHAPELEFDYKKVHLYSTVTKELLDMILNQNICFEIKGKKQRLNQIQENGAGTPETQADSAQITRYGSMAVKKTASPFSKSGSVKVVDSGRLLESNVLEKQTFQGLKGLKEKEKEKEKNGQERTSKKQVNAPPLPPADATKPKKRSKFLEFFGIK